MLDFRSTKESRLNSQDPPHFFQNIAKLIDLTRTLNLDLIDKLHDTFKQLLRIQHTLLAEKGNLKNRNVENSKIYLMNFVILGIVRSDLQR